MQRLVDHHFPADSTKEAEAGSKPQGEVSVLLPRVPGRCCWRWSGSWVHAGLGPDGMHRASAYILAQYTLASRFGRPNVSINPPHSTWRSGVRGHCLPQVDAACSL